MDTEKKETKKRVTKKTEPAKEKVTTNKKKVEPVADVPVAPKYKEMKVCTKSKLRIRSGAGMEYPIVEFFPNDTIVNVYEEKDGWARVDESNSLWVSMDYLRDI